MSAYLKRLTGILAAISMSGMVACAPLASRQEGLVEQPAIAWQSRQQLLTSIYQWQTDGRVAIQTQSDAWSASIDWDQHNDQYRIRLSGPLGSQAMQIDGDASGAALTNSSNEMFVARNATALIEHHTGWPVPVEGLRYWAIGLPDPQLQSEKKLDDHGRLSWLKQSGWMIEYIDYMNIDGIDLPRKIRLENRQLKVKLVFKSWNIDRQRLSRYE